MPAPRDALPFLIAALRETFGEDLSCALLKGSVLRDDAIPYWSDLDVHAFVGGVRDGAPDWPRALAFQRRIGALDPEAYGVGAFQVTFVPPDRYPEGWPLPYPRSYEVLHGAVPAALGAPSADEHLARAREVLASAAAQRDGVVAGYLDKPDALVRRSTRLAGTYVAAQVLSAAMLLSGDPERVVASRRAPLLHVVGEALGNERELIVFHALAREWREVRAHPDECRAMLAAGLAALDAFAASDLARGARRAPDRRPAAPPDPPR